jgi:hypothetical protein
VLVTGGIFSVQLDFGTNAFPGADRFLEIGVRPAGGGAFTILSPRQQTTSTPYAIRSANATTADSATTATTATNAATATNATQLGGVAASQYVLTGDSRLTDSRAPTANSPNYIQNTTTPQASANFNISGNGTAGAALSANAVNAATQYNIGGNRVLSIPGSSNTLVGVSAGQASEPLFTAANTFVGLQAGFSNTRGSSNSFFGYRAGLDNITGGGNTIVGADAGINFTVGPNSTNNNESTYIGHNTSAGPGLNYATAIGAGAYVTRSNSLSLGSVSPSVNVGIGTPAPLAKLDVRGDVFVGLTAVPDIVSGPGNNLYLANDSGDANNSFRLDAFGNNLYLAARSGAGAAAGAGIVFRTATAAGGERDSVSIDPFGSVSINFRPGFGAPQPNLDVAGGISFHRLTFDGGSQSLCYGPNQFISACSSSLRYKTEVQSFLDGLDIINRLRPIAFTWKQGGMRDIGFGAEEVEKVEPLLTFRNDKGEIEGVKYNQLSAVFVNAFKEQQNQIETLRAQNAALNERLRAVEKNLRKRVGSARRGRQVP